MHKFNCIVVPTYLSLFLSLAFSLSFSLSFCVPHCMPGPSLRRRTAQVQRCSYVKCNCIIVAVVVVEVVVFVCGAIAHLASWLPIKVTRCLFALSLAVNKPAEPNRSIVDGSCPIALKALNMPGIICRAPNPLPLASIPRWLWHLLIYCHF